MIRRWKAGWRWQSLALAAVGLGVIGAAGVLLVAWLGVYNVAANVGHTALVDWFLRFGMENSVKARASGKNEPSVATPEMIALGAAHYRDGCAFCHGAPGEKQAVVVSHMLPAPPPLTAVANHWSDHELHWIVMHGFKYTGMPAWPSQKRTDEAWALVAFLKALPDMDGEAYRRLADGPPLPAGTPEAVALCSRCHGAGSSPPTTALTPVIHGQPAQMIVNALRDYASGQRESGIMQPIASDLGDNRIDELARYYSALPPPRRNRVAADKTSPGGRIAHEGVPEERIPSCLGCHGPSAAPTYPRLAGQPAAFIANQLRLWKTQDFRVSPQAGIMAPIARRLTDRQIDDVAAYLESLPPETRP